MKCLPIFSPIDGIVVIDKPNQITINNTVNNNMYSPCFGMISLPNNSTLTISNPYTKITILFAETPSELNVRGSDYVKYTQLISTAVDNVELVFDIDVIVYMVVLSGTKVIGGTTIIAYVKINSNIKIHTHPKQLIILTVPHATCNEHDPKRIHTCDFFAEKLADQLAKILAGPNRSIYQYNSPINRRRVDSNRIASANTPYQKIIRNRVNIKIKEILTTEPTNDMSRIIYVLDCHSYPPGNFSTGLVPNPQVCILYASPSQMTYISTLISILNNRGISVTHFMGNGNYIIEQFYAYNILLSNIIRTNDITIVPILIEINETLSDEKILVISKSIDDWINTV